ncbi:hypothetical protein PLESHI_17022 [Plesiomonas shigelloides 302-73]|uniref:Uncharacterized protein n=1 Tax=Plesiomonas shigelloides 302-73 TaxID=1315976 RepID=R8ALG9_PLESH|nr:hypothetical protein PLESHI_17022 [Plesiomonas shigelloides 302-73]
MEAAKFGGDPDLMQWLLAVENDFAVVLKGQGHHPALGVIIDIGIDRIKFLFQRQPDGVCGLMKFSVIHGGYPIAFHDRAAIIEVLLS